MSYSVMARSLRAVPLPQREDTQDPNGTGADVAPCLSQICGEPASLHLLPTLGEIELRLANRWTAPFIRDGQRADMLAAFGSFAAARQQAGRPVKISWNEGLALPTVTHAKKWTPRNKHRSRPDATRRSVNCLRLVNKRLWAIGCSPPLRGGCVSLRASKSPMV